MREVQGVIARADGLLMDISQMSKVCKLGLVSRFEAEKASPHFGGFEGGARPLHVMAAQAEFERHERARLLALFLASFAVFESAVDSIARYIEPSVRDQKFVTHNGETHIPAIRCIISKAYGLKADAEWEAAWDRFAPLKFLRENLAHKYAREGFSLLELKADEGGFVASFGQIEGGKAIEVVECNVEALLETIDLILHKIAIAEVGVNGDHSSSEHTGVAEIGSGVNLSGVGKNAAH